MKRIIGLCLIGSSLLATSSFAQQPVQPIVDSAWRGPGWYWRQGDMFGIPILAGRENAGPNGTQLPFATEADCEQYYHGVVCNYYGSDPAQ
jgi:hypothetical protein